ncbi:MAG TPA: M23 family metallopeptidase [Gemmatimonadaceae bacterium]|nr:M23 family metallopeptidase [Gemmatimonadaceae bacterium]
MRHRVLSSRRLPARDAIVAAVLSAALLAPSGVAAQQPFEIRIAPGGSLIPQEARSPGLGYDGTSPYYELIVQAILFVNRGGEPVTVDGARIDLRRGGASLQLTEIAPAEMERAQGTATAITKEGFATGMEVLFAARALIPPGVTIAPTRTLAPGSAGLVDDTYLVVRALPDTATITVRGRTASGRAVTGRASFPVRRHASRNAYAFPLEAGHWFVLGYPGIKGHHWWTTATEHGMDITMVDARGSWAAGPDAAWREGSVPRWEDWYAYGKRVLAAADGIVEKVVSDVAFPLDVWNRRAGESPDAYHERIGARQMELFTAPGADPIAVAGGNHVIVRHANGEWTMYGHLAYGSILVKAGQSVRQGEPLAGVGGTGEEPAVHLHFQVMDGPEPTYARTYPVEFTNVRVNEHGVERYAPRMVFQSGYFVSVAPAKP